MASDSDIFLANQHGEETASKAVCRICHEEGEAGRELFYPCKCDGTIKFVHQDCLIEWIKHSPQRAKPPRCELCGEAFRFQNVYKADAPLRLTVLELFWELVPRAFDLFRTLCSLSFAILLWAVALPLVASSSLRLVWCFVADWQALPGQCVEVTARSIFSSEHFALAWYNGVVNLCIVVALSFLLFEVGRVLYKEVCATEKAHVFRLLKQEVEANGRLLRELCRSGRCLVNETLHAALTFIPHDLAMRQTFLGGSAHCAATDPLLMAAEELQSLSYHFQEESEEEANVNVLDVDLDAGLIVGDSTALVALGKVRRQLQRLLNVLERLHRVATLPLFTPGLLYLSSCSNLLDQLLRTCAVTVEDGLRLLPRADNLASLMELHRLLKARKSYSELLRAQINQFECCQREVGRWVEELDGRFRVEEEEEGRVRNSLENRVGGSGQSLELLGRWLLEKRRCEEELFKLHPQALRQEEEEEEEEEETQMKEQEQEEQKEVNAEETSQEQEQVEERRLEEEVEIVNEGSEEKMDDDNEQKVVVEEEELDLVADDQQHLPPLAPLAQLAQPERVEDLPVLLEAAAPGEEEQDEAGPPLAPLPPLPPAAEAPMPGVAFYFSLESWLTCCVFLVLFSLATLLVPALLGRLLLSLAGYLQISRKAMLDLAQGCVEDAECRLVYVHILQLSIEAETSELAPVISRWSSSALEVAVGYAASGALLISLYLANNLRYLALLTPRDAPAPAMAHAAPQPPLQPGQPGQPGQPAVGPGFSLVGMAKEVLVGVRMICKTVCLALLYGIVLPASSAYLLRKILHPIWGDSATSDQVEEVLVFGGLYLFSFLFLAHLFYLANVLRQLVAPRYRTFLLNPPFLPQLPILFGGGGGDGGGGGGGLADQLQRLVAHDEQVLLFAFLVHFLFMLCGLLVHVPWHSLHGILLFLLLLIIDALFPRGAAVVGDGVVSRAATAPLRAPALRRLPLPAGQIFPVVPLPVTLPVPVPEEVPQELVEGEGEGVAVDMEGVERENNEETEFAETLPNLNDEAEEEELHLLQGEDENELKDRDVIPPPPPPPPAAATPFPSSQQAVPAPSHVPSFHAMHLLPLELRVSMLALLLCCTLGLMSSWLLHWPLSLGRLILPFLGLSGTNKIVNYPIGLGALYMVARACVAVLRDLQHRLLGADVAPADRLVLATRLVNKWGLVSAASVAGLSLYGAVCAALARAARGDAHLLLPATVGVRTGRTKARRQMHSDGSAGRHRPSSAARDGDDPRGGALPVAPLPRLRALASAAAAAGHSLLALLVLSPAGLRDAIPRPAHPLCALQLPFLSPPAPIGPPTAPHHHLPGHLTQRNS
eukprot:scaffold6519_cov156-Ochromonas_danica.AAC.4